MRAQRNQVPIENEKKIYGRDYEEAVNHIYSIAKTKGPEFATLTIMDAYFDCGAEVSRTIAYKDDKSKSKECMVDNAISYSALSDLFSNKISKIDENDGWAEESRYAHRKLSGIAKKENFLSAADIASSDIYWCIDDVLQDILKISDKEI